MKQINFLNKLFAKWQYGTLTILLPDQQQLVFSGKDLGITADLRINNWLALELIQKRGDIGLGEAYFWGWIDSNDLANFLKYCSININSMYDHNINGNWINRLKFYYYNNYIKINTRTGAKQNILDHYDIGNDFYQLWLDPSMSYSAAIREHPNDNLNQAQLHKYRRIINKLELAGEKVLEIGCGWGGFMHTALQHTDNVTGITISRQQFEYVMRLLGNKAPVLLQDYRDVREKYTRIVSIEMFEAVGEKYWPIFFDKIKQSLVKGGKAMIQTITILDGVYNTYRKNSDYIRHYIFPGGMLPCKKVFFESLAKAKLDLVDVYEFGKDYAWTLREWLKNFKQHRSTMLQLKYSEVFLRSWEFYLSMCIAGFETGRTNVMQVEIQN